MSLSKFSLSEEELEEQAIESLLFEHIEDFVEEPLHKKKRCAKTRIDYWNTTWGRWLRNPLMQDPTSKMAKMFMLRFRVPFILFNEKILPMCIKDNVFDLTYQRNRVQIAPIPSSPWSREIL